MNPKIELIYSADCPNVQLARSRLREALFRVGMEPRWDEWDRESAGAPDYARRFGSPTVLVKRQDIAESSEAEADCCRVYPESGKFEGAPSVDALENALRGARAGAGLSDWGRRIGRAVSGASTFEAHPADLSRRKWTALLLWRLPYVLLLLGALWEPLRGLMWSGGFGWIGGSCTINAFRCGRTHCAIMGPLFLGLSVASAAAELGMLARGWGEIGLAGIGSIVVSYLPEWLGKRYLRASPGC